MENPLIQIKDAVIRILKELDPDVDVFFEGIKRTDTEHGLTQPETYYFVEVIPNINETVDRHFTDRGVLVDVAYHEENESNTAYLIKADELDGAIRPALSFGDRHITIQNTSQKVVDHVLHISFTVSFRTAEGEIPGFGTMGELEMAAGKGG